MGKRFTQVQRPKGEIRCSRKLGCGMAIQDNSAEKLDIGMNFKLRNA